MYIENGNLPVDLSSLAIAILSDEGTKEVQYLENQEQENLFQGQSYCNVNEINPSTTLINDDASKIYQEVCDCSLIQSKISKIEQCIDYFEVMVKEQAEEIHLLSLDMGHFSKKGKIIDLTSFSNPAFLILGSHRGDDIHRLGRRNLVASDSSPKVCRQSFPTTCAHSVLNSSSSTKRFY